MTTSSIYGTADEVKLYNFKIILRSKKEQAFGLIEPSELKSLLK